MQCIGSNKQDGLFWPANKYLFFFFLNRKVIEQNFGMHQRKEKKQKKKSRKK